MPRAEVGSQKWLSNKMKSKGLQKLKWYCQMCEKQCRDENGYKCHGLSEGHRRQMKIFCQNPGRFMDRFSKTFEHEFMKLMRTRYCKTRILANTVYQELISDKQHVHMNATVWVTLSEFVLYLSRSGKCKVEHTPKGWYLEYIDVDKIRRQQDEESRRKREITLEQRYERIIQQLILEAKKRGGYQEPEYTPMIKGDDEKITINTNFQEKPNKAISANKNIFKQLYKKAKSDTPSDETTSIRSSDKDEDKVIKRKPALESIMDGIKKRKNSTLEVVKTDINHEMEQSPKSHTVMNANTIVNTIRYINKDKDDWLLENILVKIILKSHPLYKRKCKVLTVINGKRALLEDPDNTNKKIELDDEYLETVIPPLNSLVKMLRGVYKGSLGTLKTSDPDNLSASILIKGKLLTDVSYDDFSTFAGLQPL